jgi:PEGA domain
MSASRSHWIHRHKNSLANVTQKRRNGRFDQRPAGDIRNIDGKYVGPAANFKIARTYEVAAGEHDVKLEDPRYQEIVRKVTITAARRPF